MTDASLFGVYTAKLSFLESNESKTRPVIVVSTPQGEHNVVVVVPVSSKPRRANADTLIRNWSNAGLSRPSVAWVHRLTTVLQANLSSNLGALSSADSQQLKNALRSLLQLT